MTQESARCEEIVRLLVNKIGYFYQVLPRKREVLSLKKKSISEKRFPE